MCRVQFAFARNPDECVDFIRRAGEKARMQDPTGPLWDDRQWLTAEEWEVRVSLSS